MSETEISPTTPISPAPPPLEDVRDALKDVIDPELGVNVIDLGLLYGLEYGQDNALLINMTLTSAACPLTEMIEEQVGKALNGVVDEWRLSWVWMPPWGPDRITDDGRDQMRGLGFKTNGRLLAGVIVPKPGAGKALPGRGVADLPGVRNLPDRGAVDP